MSFLSRLIPARFKKKKDPAEEVKNNLPKERENIKKSFAVYCNAHHNTADGKLCPRCNALLLVVMTKMNRCPYGITKPVCDRCDRPCFGAKATQEFLTIMQSTQRGMFLRHPIMTIKHKLASMGVDYAKYQQEKKVSDKAKAKEKATKARAKEKGKKK